MSLLSPLPRSSPERAAPPRPTSVEPAAPAREGAATRLPPARSKVALLSGLFLATALTRIAERLIPPPIAMMLRLGGVWQTQLLYVAARLEIADRVVDRPKTAAELAAETGSNEDALHRVLRALAALGIFKMDRAGRVANNGLSEALRGGGISSMRDAALYVGSPSNMRAWTAMDETVRTGEPAFPRVHGVSVWDWFARHPEEGRAFAGTMTSLTEQDAPSIAASYDFGRHARICDVAGGRGTLLAELLVQHAGARGVLFDEAHVLETAVPYLRARGVEGRVERVAGSFFERVPQGCDAYVLKDILHDWDDARCKPILDHVARALPAGGRLLVCEVLVEKNSTYLPGPLIDVQMLAACDGGRQRSASEMERLLSQSGLAVRKVHATKTALSIVEAAKQE